MESNVNSIFNLFNVDKLQMALYGTLNVDDGKRQRGKSQNDKRVVVINERHKQKLKQISKRG